MTPYQGTIRSSMASASTRWDALSDADRDAWADYAQTVIFSGPLGQYQITGRLMFIRCLTLPIYCDSRGLATIPCLGTPPVLPGNFDPGPIVPAIPIGPAVTGIALSITNMTGEDGFAFVERSVAFNPSRLRYKGPFLSIPAVCEDIDDGASTNITFSGLTAGLIYFTYCRCFTKEAPFRLSASYIFRHVAQTVI